MFTKKVGLTSISAILIIAILFPTASLLAETVTINPGSSVTLRFPTTITANQTSPGSQTPLVVVDGIYVGNKLVVSPGASAIGTVSYNKHNGIIGAPGAISVEATSVQAIDGSQIPVTGSISIEGKSNTLLAVLLGLFICPAACLIQGENAKVIAGSTINARVTGLNEVNIK